MEEDSTAEVLEERDSKVDAVASRVEEGASEVLEAGA